MRKLSLKELNRLNPEEFQKTRKTPVTLVLDNVRSGLNVGSAFRTADAFALEGVVLTGITAQPPHREILKTAIGATETVSWSYEKKTVDALNKLKSKEYQIWIVEQTDNSTSLEKFTIPSWQTPIALVFGNEVSGVTEEAVAMADGALEIRQFGTKHSLNISVCVGIVSWEVSRQYRQSSH